MKAPLSFEHKEKISMSLKGRSPSLEHRRKISEVLKGRPSPNKGKPRSLEVRQKVSQTLMGHPVSPEARAKMSASHKGKPGHKGFHFKHTEEAKKKISLAGIGHLTSEETRQKISAAQKGRILSFDQRKRLSLAHIGKQKGKNNPAWQGGIASLPYAYGWGPELKREVMERDGRRCRNPGCRKTARRLAVHHIDYNKMNCDPSNLITLCTSCNARANTDRKLYVEFYKILREAICRRNRWNTIKT